MAKTKADLKKPRIPVTDEDGFFEIRMESIGGLGAHLAGQILAEAAVLGMNFNGAHFSSYGSEKKGSPIKSFVRLCETDRQIRIASPVETPHIIAIFHDALLTNPGTISGLREGGALIINTVKSLDELGKYLEAVIGKVDIWSLDALGIAVAEKSRVNTALMGAVVKLSGFLDADVVLATLADKFQKKHPSAVEPNKKTFLRGMQELKLISKAGVLPNSHKPVTRPQRALPVYGYKTAPIGGLVINPGNTVLNDMSTSRQGFLPHFNKDACVNCGLCDLVCPDQCFVWDVKEETRPDGTKVIKKVDLKGIDYMYCKGCMRCVDSCPSGALTKEREAEGYAKSHRVAEFVKDDSNTNKERKK